MMRSALRMACVCALLLAARTAQAAPDLTKIKLYGNNTQYSVGVKGRLLVNGVEVQKMEGKGGSSSGGTLQLWLMPGVNVFELEITELTKPEDAKPWYKFTLHGLVEQGFPDDENQIFAFNWPESDADAKPMTKRFEYKVVAAPPSAIWSKAQKLTKLDAAAETALKARVVELQDAFRKKDAAKAVELRRFTFEDSQRVFGQDPPKDLSAVVKSIKKLLSEKSLKFVLVDPAKLRFDLVAGGHLVRVAGPNGEPPIAGKMKDGSMDVMPYYANIDGTWTLVR